MFFFVVFSRPFRVERNTLLYAYIANFFSIFCALQTKFGIVPGDEASIRAIVQSYLEGLYWVLTYYHQGCGSWTWFYPYLYAPLASDLVGLGELKAHFEPGRPFTPLMQLLSVLPPQSGTIIFPIPMCLSKYLVYVSKRIFI